MTSSKRNCPCAFHGAFYLAVELWPLLGILLLEPGCGRIQEKAAINSPDQARAKLGQLGKDYSKSEFVITAGKGDLTAVRLFLDAGMDVNASMSDGMTALHYASLTGEEGVASLLIEKGANVNSIDRVGVPPLMCAAHTGQPALVSLLISKGARVNTVDEAGRSALWMAADARIENLPVVRLLLKAGADVNTGKEGGWTVLDTARQQGHMEIVNLLETAGAK